VRFSPAASTLHPIWRRVHRPKCLSFLVSIAGTTGMNMSIENNMLPLICQTISMRPVPWFIDFLLPSISPI